MEKEKEVNEILIKKLKAKKDKAIQEQEIIKK